jgi:hypothetical protein
MIWIFQVFGDAPSTLEVDGGADGMDFESSNPVALPVDEPSPVASSGSLKVLKGKMPMRVT